MLDKLLVSDILYAATSTGAEFAEVFVENNKKNSLGLINGKLERALSGIDFGIGIRIINKDRMVYVYTNKKDRESLINLAKNGATAIKGNSKQKQIVFNDLDYRKINNNNIEIYPSSIYSNKIVEIMKLKYPSRKKNKYFKQKDWKYKLVCHLLYRKKRKLLRYILKWWEKIWKKIFYLL